MPTKADSSTWPPESDCQAEPPWVADQLICAMVCMPLNLKSLVLQLTGVVGPPHSTLKDVRAGTDAPFASAFAMLK